MKQENGWTKLEKSDQLEEGSWYHVCTVSEGKTGQYVGVYYDGCLENEYNYFWKDGSVYYKFQEVWIQKISMPDPPSILNLNSRERWILESVRKFKSKVFAPVLDPHQVSRLVDNIENVLTKKE